MNKIVISCLLFTILSCNNTNHYQSSIEFTTDFSRFDNLAAFKESLKHVEIIALGENTHGLGEVFRTKTEVVKFLHEELGFDMVVFESGYGDAALAWDQLETLSPLDYTLSFNSYFYYHCEELKELIEYVKTRDRELSVQGFDCQVQQDYLIRRMAEIMQPIDSVFANSVPQSMYSFNNIYQHEYQRNNQDFDIQKEDFISFINKYDNLLKTHQVRLTSLGTTSGEIKAIHRTLDIIRNTYGNIQMGDLMGWPDAYNIRDRAMFENVKWFIEQHPGKKIILWAQNGHIENNPCPDQEVKWMGHYLKELYGDKYYSVGAVVYQGTCLNNKTPFDFENNTQEHLAYHLNQFDKPRFIVDFRKHYKDDFTAELQLLMSVGGNTKQCYPKNTFDGVLFIQSSGMPMLIEK